MAFEITEKNASALLPLFKPWEEPTLHRRPNPIPGGPAVITPGRRPSKCQLVRSIRAQVDGWRRGGYAGVSDTSRRLLNFWFQTDHLVLDEDGNSTPFHYHWAQREAIETIIYLYELRAIRNVAFLLTEFGDRKFDDIALGIPPDQDRWPKNCCKVATGGGKTKVMSLAIVWSYFHSLYEKDFGLARHFLIIAPNLTVYERLKDDFENCEIFYRDPILPDEWKTDFQMQVILQEEPGGASTTGAIYLTNIHRLYEKQENEKDENGNTSSIFGPPVKRTKALDTGEALRDRITNHPRLMVLNDEAHHLHDPELAWNKAIDAIHHQSLSKEHSGIYLQVDFTATPKDANGKLFNHIICDFPLGEAVDAGIVKVPVLGESEELVAHGDRKTPAHERYAMHLKLGYERYKKTYEEFRKVRKPILFVMTEEAESANEIADFLDSGSFPLIKGRVLNIHTRLKGRIKTVMRSGKEIKEFIESETGMKPDDLKELREMSRELDKKDSKFRCIVSVMMLREGWDVKNVTTIVPLRPYSAKSGILPEQTLGRGLRRMFPQGEMPEMVTVVHHPAFRKLYEEELAQEGLDIAILPVRESIKQTVTIYVAKDKKPVESLEIEIPSISDAVESTAELQGMTFDEVKIYFIKHFRPLPIGKKREGIVEYKERHLFTDEIVARMQIDAGLLTNAWSAAGYFAQMLGRACRISNPHQTLTPLVEEVLSRMLFERNVDLYSGEVDHRMRDMDVLEHVRATFTPLILAKTVRKKDRRRISHGQKLSTWRPFQATSTEKRPAVEAQRTMFNLVPCENEFERVFTDFCDYAEDVVAFAKNGGPQKLMMDYLRPDGHRAFYVPDFFVRQKDGACLLCELKGKEDILVPLKARAAVEWCKVASKGRYPWRYLYIPYHLFQQSAPNSIEELVRACEPAQKSLLKEAETGQQELPIAEAEVRERAEALFVKTLGQAGIIKAPVAVESAMRQAAYLLDHAVRSGMPDLGHAFQPLLAPLDEFAIKILDKFIRPRVPSVAAKREVYFTPYLGNIHPKERALLEKNGRYLKDNLIYGRSIMKLGTLLFCLDYARGGGCGASGIWKDVEQAFSARQMEELCSLLAKVNDFRNKHVAHVEELLKNAAQAWKAMILWLKCLKNMIELST
ncbi:MAG: DEAD/DEAH box helicase family protein [Candidatus Aminicenantales bacterium]